ncbi:MAG: hypothetical protein ACRC50_06320 [Gaiella sp.]
MPRTAAIVAAGLSAIAIAASGCTGGSEGEAEGRPVDVTRLRTELKERFGTPPNEAPWYRHIVAITMFDGRLEITTDLNPDEYRDDLTRAVCLEPLKLALEQAEPQTIDLTARVFGPGQVAMGACA